MPFTAGFPEENAKRKEMLSSFVAAEPSQALDKPLENFVERLVGIALDENFDISKTGVISLKDGADPMKAFGSGFRSLQMLYNKAEGLTEGFAVAEARLALAAQMQFGKDWPNFFPQSNGADIARIKKNSRALAIFTSAGATPRDTPITVIRLLANTMYHMDINKNDKIRDQVIRNYAEHSRIQGKALSLRETGELIAEVTSAHVPHKEPVTKAIVNPHTRAWPFQYFMVDWDKQTVAVLGSRELDEEMWQRSSITTDDSSRRLIKDTEGKWDYLPITTYAGKGALASVVEQAAFPKGRGADLVPEAPETVEPILEAKNIHPLTEADLERPEVKELLVKEEISMERELVDFEFPVQEAKTEELPTRGEILANEIRAEANHLTNAQREALGGLMDTVVLAGADLNSLVRKPEPEAKAEPEEDVLAGIFEDPLENL